MFAQCHAQAPHKLRANGQRAWVFASLKTSHKADGRTEVANRPAKLDWRLPLARPIHFAILFLSLSSCQEYTDWPLNLAPESRLVVEAILTNESKTQEIRLSQSFNDINGQASAVVDAKVSIETNGTVYPFDADASNPGLYKSENPFTIVNDLIYTLNIEWEGEVYTASSELSNVGPMPNIFFQSDITSDSLTFGNFVPTYSTSQPAMYEMHIDWSHLSNEIPTQARMYFYTFNSFHINQLIPPRKQRVFFPKGSIVIAQKYGLNDDFADYLRSMVIETDWTGNVFYAPSDNLPTNISNGAYGFFSTCAVVVDTLVAE